MLLSKISAALASPVNFQNSSAARIMEHHSELIVTGRRLMALSPFN